MKAFFLKRSPTGWREGFALDPAPRLIFGRSSTCQVPLEDELCSRQHAELSFVNGQWTIRDLGSRNGTLVNDEPIVGTAVLRPQDRLTLGKTELLFVHDPADAPTGEAHTKSLTPPPTGASTFTIALRQGAAKLLSQSDAELAKKPDAGHELARLYRLAVKMGSSVDERQLAAIVLDHLLGSTHADTVAILAYRAGGQLELLAHSGSGRQSYHRFSEFLNQTVLREKEAILAHDISRDRHLRDRESIQDLEAHSAICAPIRSGERLLGLVHLYSTRPDTELGGEDLDHTLAVTHQLAAAWQGLCRQNELQAGLEQIRSQNQRLQETLRTESELVGQSEVISKILEQIRRAAPTTATVLIRGESGVGKELVARAIHLSSARREGPLVCLNCAALTETLLESELFGHEKGAFTGATEQKIGKFEAADGGTLFLDEIGEMKPATQAKFLRALEGHPFERVGGQQPIQVSVRVVAATNRRLEEAVAAGQFRRDLYFRLHVVEVVVPPLRDRKEDIPLLAEHFLRRLAAETGRRIRGFSKPALQLLMDHNWPGNVRELRNAIERAVVLGTSEEIEADDLLLSTLETASVAAIAVGYRPMSLDEVEQQHIAATLSHTDWNKSRTAAILGIERSTLDRKIKQYRLTQE